MSEFATSRSILLLALAGSLVAGGGCADGGAPSPVETVTPEAVERFRTGAIVALQEVDADIALLEGTANQADSAAAIAYGRALDSIRQERQDIQSALDTLHGSPTVAFGEATQRIDADIAALGRRVERAPIELAPTAAALRAAALDRLASLEAEWGPPSPAALPAGEWVQRRQQIEGVLGRLGSDASFSAVRAEVARLFAALEDRIATGSEEAPAPPVDTTATEAVLAE